MQPFSAAQPYESDLAPSRCWLQGSALAVLWCRDWLDNYKSQIHEQEERRRKEEEESRPVGPAPPPKSRVDDPSSYGINLRPGEGERCSLLSSSCSAVL